MNISILVGDLASAQVDALCTSTNPKLTLVMGTGASVRDRGGFEILRQCEAIVDAELKSTGRRELPAGSVHVTTAGTLPAKIAIHCVASDASHRSSAAIIKACVTNALQAADARGCRSIAMPVFATGHVGFNFDRAVVIMAEAIREAFSVILSREDGEESRTGQAMSERDSSRSEPALSEAEGALGMTRAIDNLVIVVSDTERADAARKLIANTIPGCKPAVVRAPSIDDEPRSIWSEE